MMPNGIGVNDFRDGATQLGGHVIHGQLHGVGARSDRAGLV